MAAEQRGCAFSEETSEQAAIERGKGWESGKISARPRRGLCLGQERRGGSGQGSTLTWHSLSRRLAAEQKLRPARRLFHFAQEGHMRVKTQKEKSGKD